MLSKAPSSSQVGTLLWSMRLVLHTSIRTTLGLLPDLCFEALAWAAVKAPAGPAGGHSSPLAAPISLGPSPCTPTAHRPTVFSLASIPLDLSAGFGLSLAVFLKHPRSRRTVIM